MFYASFQLPGSRYYVGLIDDHIARGGGIYPSPGLSNNVCELVKMYLRATIGNTGHYGCSIWMLREL